MPSNKNTGTRWKTEPINYHIKRERQRGKKKYKLSLPLKRFSHDFEQLSRSPVWPSQESVHQTIAFRGNIKKNPVQQLPGQSPISRRKKHTEGYRAYRWNELKIQLERGFSRAQSSRAIELLRDCPATCNYDAKSDSRPGEQVRSR